MKIVFGVLAALPLLAMAGNSLAQSSYPEQTVRILVGFPPGVAPDVSARLVADKLAIRSGISAEFAAAIERETPQWARVIRQAGIRAE